jgi:Rha family phage regulatory protein
VPAVERLPDGTVVDRGGVIVTDSVAVATAFGKSHKNILGKIRGLLNIGSDLSACSWFLPTTTPVTIGNGAVRLDDAFEMTRDGLSLLVMGFTGARAHRFKVLFIEEFNRMEAALRTLSVDPMAVWRDPVMAQRLHMEATQKLIAAETKADEAVEIASRATTQAEHLRTEVASWVRCMRSRSARSRRSSTA